MAFCLFITGVIINFVFPFLYAYYGFRIHQSYKKGIGAIEQASNKYDTVFLTCKYTVGGLQLVSAIFMLWAIYRIYTAIK